MSNTQFQESQSDDPVERAIARRVHRILNDPTLDRSQRESLVRKAQRDLVQHRKQQADKQKLQAQASAARLPKGYRPQSILVSEGRVQVGALSPKQGFMWMDAGPSPVGTAANGRLIALQGKTKGSKTKAPRDPIAERRREFFRTGT